MDDFTLFRAFEKDAGLLAAIHEECFPNYWNSEAFTDFFSVAGTYAYRVGEQAMIVYRMAADQADIITLAVRPSSRRRGLARRMVQMAMEHLQKLGATSVFLDVEDGNIAAIALYKGLGFSQSGRRKLYYRQKDGTYTDALVMTRKLD